MTWFNDSINPIVIKELRQAVRSKFVIAMLMLLLGVQLFVIGAFLVTSGNISLRFDAGRQVFMILLTMMLGTCLLFVPIYTAIRLALERSDTHVDLLFITTIQPRAIIGGKFLAAIILTVLIFSACMPFMTFTYFLRGIDLPSIFVLLVFGFFVVAVSIQLAIFIACIPASRVFKVLLGLGGLNMLSYIVIMTLGGFYGLLGFGVGSLLGTWEFWGYASLIGIFGLTVFGLFFVLSVALITPPSANRALPVRIFLTTAWLITGISSAVWGLVTKQNEPVIGWGFLSVGVFCIAFFMAVSEREHLSRRVIRTIPYNRWVRLITFPFYSGAASGITWSWIMISFTLGVILAWEKLIVFHPYRNFSEGIEWMAGVSLYAFCYSMSASLLRRRFLADKIRPGYTWIIALILLMIGSLTPFLIIFFFSKWDTWWRLNELGVWLMSNPFALGIDAHRPFYLTFVSGWAFLVVMLSLPWFMKQVRSFKPIEINPGFGTFDPKSNSLETQNLEL